MKRTLRVLRDAEAELQSTAIWYEEKRRGLGIEFVAVEATPWLLAGSSTVQRVAKSSASKNSPAEAGQGGDPNDAKLELRGCLPA
jgi:hypothetical protein